jgi:hypothetical protein
MKKDILTRPFPPEQLRTRRGQNGKQFSYVEAHTVVTRLNEATDYEWTFEVLKHEILADEVIVLGRLVIDGVAKMAFGGSSVTRDSSGKEMSIADDLKAASADATKKAASLFGCGLELYGAAPSASPRPRAAEDGPPPPRTEDRLTPRQLSALQAASRRRGWSAAQLSAMSDERFQKNNIQALTRAEASALLSELSGLNGH